MPGGCCKLVLEKFGLCLKLIGEMKVKTLLECLENLHTPSLVSREGVFIFSKHSNDIFTFISPISFRHKPNFPSTTANAWGTPTWGLL